MLARGLCLKLEEILSIFPMKDDLLREASKVIKNPNILVNLVSKRMKQLKQGMEPLVESLGKLELEDVALLEIIQGKISYELYQAEDTSLPTAA